MKIDGLESVCVLTMSLVRQAGTTRVHKSVCATKPVGFWLAFSFDVWLQN